MSETETRAYELGYLLVPTLPETEAPATTETLQAAIQKAGAVIHPGGGPEFIDLAYVMEKTVASKKSSYSQGYFTWLKFEAVPEVVESIKKMLDADASIIRYLLVKTDLTNAVVFKKPKIEAVRELLADEEAQSDEAVEGDDDLKEDHEMLPDVANDIIEETSSEEGTVEEPVESEE